MKKIIPSVAFLACLAAAATGQVPASTALEIVRAEDARRFDARLDNLIRSPGADVRRRAALAAGRIGDADAVPALVALVEGDQSPEVRAAAAFGLGEIESIEGADAILRRLDKREAQASVIARLVEAAGKIAAANTTHPKSKQLGEAIVKTLRNTFDRETILLGLTAVLRLRPDKGAETAARLMTHGDARVRADAANTLSRLRAKNANSILRSTVSRDTDAVARANAARALGAAEDKESLEALLNAATKDEDPRVRVSAIRSLAAMKDQRAAPFLLEHGNALLKEMSGGSIAKPQPRSTRNPFQKNELLEIATALGRILPRSGDVRVIEFLNHLRAIGEDAETHIAAARIAPDQYLGSPAPAFGYSDFHAAAAYGQGLGTIAEFKDDVLTAEAGRRLTAFVAGMATGVRPRDQAQMLKAMPDLTRAMAALKSDNLDQILLGQLKNEDVFLRAAAAELLAEQPRTDENVEALKAAWIRARLIDKHDNDAKLAILDALAKVDKKGGAGTFLLALDDPDYVVRRKAFELLSDKQLEKDMPGLPTMIQSAREKHKDEVLRYSPIAGTKLGQVLNTDADLRRALARKNGSVKAVVTTEKGAFTIALFPEEAPLTVDNFIKLARARYFNGLEVHRVVPNFVMQDGDPRGDGNGGPGWSIRCEINMLPYDRGAVGMALSGKDTGGSQWFVTHSPQPHLDGGYTVFGRVSESDMKVVDNIVRGDRILNIRIVGR